MGCGLRAHCAHAHTAAQNEAGESALHIAVDHGSLEAVRALLAAGANVNAVEPDDACTPLVYTAFVGDGGTAVALAKALLEAGADAGARCADGTAADVARVQGSAPELLAVLAA